MAGPSCNDHVAVRRFLAHHVAEEARLHDADRRRPQCAQIT
jgi:hypothetical protein